MTEHSGREALTLEQLQVLARTRGYEFSTDRLTAIAPVISEEGEEVSKR